MTDTTTEQKYTAGPWTVAEELLIGRILVRDAVGDVIVEVIPIASGVAMSDARLIAAAPELLESLTELHRQAQRLWDAECGASLFEQAVEVWSDLIDAIEVAKRTLDKAEGQAS